MLDLEKIGCRFGHYWIWTSIENRTGMCVKDSENNCNNYSDSIGFCQKCNEGYTLAGNGKGNSICEATNISYSYLKYLAYVIALTLTMYILFVYLRRTKVSEMVRIERKMDFKQKLVNSDSEAGVSISASRLRF